MAKTVLIVEDNELNMKLFHDLLDAQGYATLQTREGLQALSMAREHRPDLILMDIQLPEISGLEVTKWLKEDDDLSHIPVVAVTAFAMKGDEERIRDGGCEAYISKPISVTHFLETIRRLIEKGTVVTARILVVDDMEANVRLLEAKLSAEYYDVLTARDGATALAMAAAEKPDIILLDVMMPGMDGFQVCRRLKDDPETRHIPVVLVTALDGRADRITGLDAGADEFLTKPIDDVLLFARVRSLTRLRMVIDELRQREASGRRIGVIASVASRLGGVGGRVLIVDDNERQAQRISAEIGREHRPVIETEMERALMTARGPVDLIIVNAAAKAFDGLRMCAALRSDEATRLAPILVILDPDERSRMVKALELGVNDILTRPIDPQELAARARTQIKRKRYTDFLRNNLDHSLELAVTDQLTGLHNRRYMEGQLTALATRANMGGDPVSALMIDIDHFKKINDGYGHDVGDEVLREFAVRVASNVRAIDLPCRFGGEEFVVIMPGARLEDAQRVAERIRTHVAGSPFRVAGGTELLTVTISVGVAATQGEGDTPEALLKRADDGVYEAKATGRNRVIARAA